MVDELQELERLRKASENRRRISIQKEPRVFPAAKTSRAIVIGWLLVGLGLAGMGYAMCLFDVGIAGSEVVNLDLLNQRLMLTITGASLLIVGTMSISVGVLIRVSFSSANISLDSLREIAQDVAR